MQPLLTWALAGTAGAALVLLLKATLFLCKCLRAHRKFITSPIPGPPKSRKILGASGVSQAHTSSSSRQQQQQQQQDQHPRTLTEPAAVLSTPHTPQTPHTCTVLLLTPAVPSPQLTTHHNPQTIGHIPDIYGPKGIWVMAQWAQQYGPLYKVHFLDECVLVCTDPEANARITRRTGACGCVWGRGEWGLIGGGRVERGGGEWGVMQARMHASEWEERQLHACTGNRNGVSRSRHPQRRQQHSATQLLAVRSVVHCVLVGVAQQP
jgi:hypothetical protein